MKVSKELKYKIHFCCKSSSKKNLYNPLTITPFNRNNVYIFLYQQIFGPKGCSDFHLLKKLKKLSE